MKKFSIVFLVLPLVFGQLMIYAQEDDDLPYLLDEDIAALEIMLPNDIPARVVETAPPPAPEPSQVTARVVETVPPPASEPGQVTVRNEITSLKVTQPLYHLLILDRTRCPLDSDISGISNNAFLYKLKHGRNGYLIAIYISPKEGPVFPVFPNNSYILVNLTTNRLSTIKGYVNSAAFRSFVTNRTILAQINQVL